MKHILDINGEWLLLKRPEAWNAGFTGQGAKVFILDSGIDADNPDLAPNLNIAPE